MDYVREIALAKKDPKLVDQLREFQDNPNSYIFASLADAYRKHSMLEQALEICEEGLERHPDFQAGIFVQAKCQFDLKRYANCLKNIKRLLQANPENVRALRLEADLYIRLGQQNQASRVLQKVLAIVPKDARAKRELDQIEALLLPIAEQTQEKPEVHMTSASQGSIQDFQVSTVEQIDEAQLQKIESDSVESDRIETAIPEEAAATSSTEVDDEFDVGTFATHTVADLYMRQNLKNKARVVLEAILARDPQDLWAKEKLATCLDTKPQPKLENTRPKYSLLQLKAQKLEHMLGQLQSLNFSQLR